MGDGTTSVVLLAGEVLKNCKPFIEDNVHPQIIVRGLRKAAQLALDRVKTVAVHVKKDNPSCVTHTLCPTLTVYIVMHACMYFRSQYCLPGIAMNCGYL